MSNGLEHSEVAEALGAYALDALPEDECVLVREHLSTCRECRAELDWLRGGVDVLPVSVQPVSPPPELKARVMEIVRAEAKLLQAAGATADQPPSSPPRRRWRWPWPGLHPMRLAPVLAAATIAAVVAIVVSVGGSATRTITAQITPPGAHASLRVRGTTAELVVRGLTAPAADHVDELWVKGPGAAPPQPAGTFVVESGSVQVGRPVRRGDLVMVTVERGRGRAAPTTRPIIVARA